jgi:hypothetical protein
VIVFDVSERQEREIAFKSGPAEGEVVAVVVGAIPLNRINEFDRP